MSRRPRRPSTRLLLCVLVAAVLVVAGCSGPADPVGPDEPRPTSPFAACPLASAEPPSGPEALPDVTLPCFTGDEPVALNRLGRPAVINLWASWCTPCRQELPHLQAFADEAGDRLLVLGVVTDDRWEWAASAGERYGVRFPSVFDPSRTLQRRLGLAVLPMTLFVAADGTVRATDVSGSLTLETLRSLAASHLGYES
jgi:thiol-disulfide isomerase/thioredoxin